MDILSRKEKIILTTIDIIDDIGINNLSTRELAKRQGITDASLYKHFKSKDEILNGVLDYFSKFDDSIFNTVEHRNMDAKEAVLFIVKAFAEYYQSYPAITAVLYSYETLLKEKNTAEFVRQIYTNRHNRLKRVILQGQDKQELSRSFTAEILADIILGLIKETTFRWRFNDYNFSLKDSVLEATRALLDK